MLSSPSHHQVTKLHVLVKLVCPPGPACRVDMVDRHATGDATEIRVAKSGVWRKGATLRDPPHPVTCECDPLPDISA